MGESQLELSPEAISRLVRFAYMTCRDLVLAHDLVQEAVYRVLRKQPDIESVEAYLKATIVNVYIGWGRRLSSTEVTLDDVKVPESRGFEDDVVERLAMWGALGRLSKRQRVVLALRYYEGLSDRDIAALLDWREATVRSLASRGLQALRAQPQFRALRSSYVPVAEGGPHD